MEEKTKFPAKPVLKAEKISTEYFRDGKSIKILKNFSAEFYPGQATAVIGESGSGKTTLALALMRLIMPWEGRIVGGKALLNLNGNIVDIFSLKEEEMLKIRGKEIAFIPQDASAALNPVLKIFYQMDEAIKDNKLSDKEKKSLLARALEEVKLPSERILNSYPHQLSGGQKQRVMIAAAIINAPRLIIADEPTIGLDVAVAREILAIFSNLKKQSADGRNSGAAFIFITHDIRMAASFCDCAIILYAGKICEFSSLKSIIRSPKHPYTKGLMESLPDIKKISEPIKPLEGSPPIFSSEDTNNCPFAPRCRFRMKICERETPPLLSVGQEEAHSVACFLYYKNKSV